MKGWSAFTDHLLAQAETRSRTDKTDIISYQRSRLACVAASSAQTLHSLRRHTRHHHASSDTHHRACALHPRPSHHHHKRARARPVVILTPAGHNTTATGSLGHDIPRMLLFLDGLDGSGELHVPDFGLLPTHMCQTRSGGLGFERREQLLVWRHASAGKQQGG